VNFKDLLKKAVQRFKPASKNIRKDVIRYPISKESYLEVFWKALEIGRGPAVSLVVHGREVMKFDCFGGERGHFHIYYGPLAYLKDPSRQRLYFYEKSIDEQIERSIFELRTNIFYYLERHPDAKIRGFKPDTEKLNEATLLAKDKMFQYIANSFAGAP